ncbi:uncharacterized protein LOC130745485 isoform X2 [Lotus japonicus]|uniref:uncharacterized protein LOC130745485 isoform X2 n=1 Tax=Lotus japonicus TaxID=34305 RepID=UPI00258583D4|nr:uncharacterized protein LOC130745485 isoform X2 [Lotus japonicus]
MAGCLNQLSSLRSGKSNGSIRVRIIHMWESCPVNLPMKPYSLHIVLIDSEGVRIEAIARNNLITKFKNDLLEGKVYRISTFMVSTNSGFFMASHNEFKINFVDKTKVVLEEAPMTPMIPLNMFTFRDSEEIIATGGDYNYLIVGRHDWLGY